MTDAYDRYVTPLGSVDEQALAEFWGRFLGSIDADPATPVPFAGPFGDTVELADELIGLVLAGQKRATAGSLAEYEADGEPVAEVGDRWIALDGSMRPRAVLETTDVRVGPMSSVDDQFAWDEGEGDRTRAAWLRDHTWYFERTFGQRGWTFHPDIPLAFERFTVVFADPPADAAASATR